MDTCFRIFFYPSLLGSHCTTLKLTLYSCQVLYIVYFQAGKMCVTWSKQYALFDSIRDRLISKTELDVVFLEFLICESLLWLIKWQILYYSVLQSHTVAFLKIIIFQNPTKPNQLKLFPQNLNFILCYLFLFIAK